MTDAPALFYAWLAGVLLGLMFFGGLWWTIRRSLFFAQPALWFMASLLVRTPIVLAGFYFVALRGWRPLLACLFGFIVVRFLATRFGPAPRIRSRLRTGDAGA